MRLEEEKNAGIEEEKKALERRGSKKKRIIAIIILILIIIAAVVIYILTHRSGEAMNEGNYQQIMEEMDDRVSEGYFETYMNNQWTFADGTSETKDAILGNSPNNAKPIRCEVVLDDTGEKVFSTDVMPVGAELPPFKLDVDLDAGTYNATCNVFLLDEEEDGTYTDFSSAGFKVTIVVEN